MTTDVHGPDRSTPADPGTGLSLPVLVAGLLAAAVAGDAVGYWSGRRFGRPWLLRRAGRAFGPKEAIGYIAINMDDPR